MLCIFFNHEKINLPQSSLSYLSAIQPSWRSLNCLQKWLNHKVQYLSLAFNGIKEKHLQLSFNRIIQNTCFVSNENFFYISNSTTLFVHQNWLQFRKKHKTCNSHFKNTRTLKPTKKTTQKCVHTRKPVTQQLRNLFTQGNQSHNSSEFCSHKVTSHTTAQKCVHTRKPVTQKI